MKQTKQVTLDIANFSFDLHIETHGESDLVSRMLLADKIWEAYETELMIHHVHAGNCVVDIGANLGYYSLIASKLVDDSGKVFAFEPEPKNFHLLEHNIKLNELNNVHCFQSGLGNKNTNIDFFINTENRGDHRAFDSRGDSENNREKTSVKILVGDEVLGKQKIDFIKIDTQGYELQILQGLRETICANQNHLKMILEFWPFALEKNGSKTNLLINELEQYPLRVSIIDHINHQLLDTSFSQLKQFAEKELAPSTQGFINLWLTPK